MIFIFEEDKQTMPNNQDTMWLPFDSRNTNIYRRLRTSSTKKEFVPTLLFWDH